MLDYVCYEISVTITILIVPLFLVPSRSNKTVFKNMYCFFMLSDYRLYNTYT